MTTEWENDFPAPPTVVHELGHCLVAWLLAEGSGIAFYTRHPDERAFASYSSAGVSPPHRLAIAVAGAVAESLATEERYMADAPGAYAVFLGNHAGLRHAYRGDVASVEAFAAQAGVDRAAAIAAGIQRAQELLQSVGGGPLIATLSDGIIGWLNRDDRARWKYSLDDHHPLSSVNFTEAELHALLGRIAARPEFRDGCTQVRQRIDAAISRRAADRRQ